MDYFYPTNSKIHPKSTPRSSSHCVAPYVFALVRISTCPHPLPTGQDYFQNSPLREQKGRLCPGDCQGLPGVTERIQPCITSNDINVYTSKWKILQESRFPFCKIAHFLVRILMFTLVKENLAKKPLSFLQDHAFTSNNLNVYTSKWNILQKSSFPFRKIAHLLVIILMFILVNGISCKKPVFLFARSLIY